MDNHQQASGTRGLLFTVVTPAAVYGAPHAYCRTCKQVTTIDKTPHLQLESKPHLLCCILQVGNGARLGGLELQCRMPAKPLALGEELASRSLLPGPAEAPCPAVFVAGRSAVCASKRGGKGS